MYRKTSKDQLLFDFALPFGGKLNAENRWVKMSRLIPWEEFEDRYSELFAKDSGVEAKSFRLALGTLIIKEHLGLSDREVIEQLCENPYLQLFVGLPSFTSKKPCDASMLTHFRKRITPEILCEVNQAIISAGLKQAEESSSRDDDRDEDGDLSGGSNNSGKLCLDATVAPADVRYPTDVSLVNECRISSEKILDVLYLSCGGESFFGRKPRTHRKIASKQYSNYIKHRKPSSKRRRRAWKKQLTHLRRNIGSIHALLDAGALLTGLSSSDYHRLLVITEVLRQQSELYRDKKRRIDDRIVSVSQPHVRPIVRGKAGQNVEFGAKLSASSYRGFLSIDKVSWDNYNESHDLQMQVEAYRLRTGYYPESVHVDKIYRTKENRKWCKERGIRISGPRLGRPPKELAIEDKLQAQEDERYRNRIEGLFGRGKRRFGLGRLSAKLANTSLTQICLIALVMNLERFFFNIFSIFKLFACLIIRHKARVLTAVRYFWRVLAEFNRYVELTRMRLLAY